MYAWRMGVKVEQGHDTRGAHWSNGLSAEIGCYDFTNGVGGREYFPLSIPSSRMYILTTLCRSPGSPSPSIQVKFQSAVLS